MTHEAGRGESGWKGAAEGNVDIGALAGQAAGGGVAGAIVTAIVGLIKKQMAGAK